MPKFEIILDAREQYTERFVVEAATREEAEEKVFTEEPVEQTGGKINREIVTCREMK